MDISGTHRPWEATRKNTNQPSSQTPQTLPSISTLTGNINNAPVDKSPLELSMSAVERDSGNWSMPQSARSSTYSTCGTPYLNSSQHCSNRFSGPEASPGLMSAGAQPPPGLSSLQNIQPLPPINQNIESLGHRGSGGDFQESRGSSIDSRIHQGFDNLALNPGSPYGSTNASQTSIVSGLNRERGIQTNGCQGPRYGASGPMSPLGPQNSRGGFTAGRVAPPILENPRSDIYNAEAPTAGQAYAFPDPEARPGHAQSNYSRRNSYAESYTSSIYTTDSRLPPGQQELHSGTHHHSLQHKQVKDIMEDPDSPNSTTPYSRTPELRVTHKLAERKRRSEMKDCFELLRSRLPPSPSNKSSKWETLSRAIDYIQSLEDKNKQSRSQIEKLHQRQGDMEMQLKEMAQQLQRLQQHSHGSYDTPPNTMPQSNMFGGHYNNGVGNAGDPPRTLPPLMNGVAMQGVQYSDERR